MTALSACWWTISSWENIGLVSCVSQNLSLVSLPRIWIFAHGPYLGNVGDILFHLSSRAPPLHLWVDELSHDWVKTRSIGDPRVGDSLTCWCCWRVLASKAGWWCWLFWLSAQNGGPCWLHRLSWKLTPCSVSFSMKYLMKYVLFQAMVKIVFFQVQNNFLALFRFGLGFSWDILIVFWDCLNER